jgi:hypothetical protein
MLLNVSRYTVAGRQINPHNAGFAPMCISELKMARFVEPSLDLVPISIACFNPARELINVALKRLSY